MSAPGLPKTDVLMQAFMHELRQPMMGAKAGLTFLERSLTVEQRQSRDYRLIASQFRWLEEVVSVFEELAAGQPPTASVFQLGPSVEHALELMTPLLKDRSMAVESEIPAGKLAVMGASKAVIHAVTNVVKNALDALGDTPGRIAVRVEKVGSRAEVRVSDNGPGISDAIHDRIFDSRFTTNRGFGRGLGLFIARQLLLRCGGDLVLRPKGSPNRADWASTEFAIVLPLAEAADNRAATAVVSAKMESKERDRILVVDDEQAVRFVVARALEQEGFATGVAASLREAEVALNNDVFQLMVVDKNLPDGTGVDLARIVRKLKLNIAILMLTGFPSLESSYEAQALGIDGYLEKPIGLDTLVERVRYALQYRRAQRLAEGKPARGLQVKILGRSQSHWVQDLIHALDELGYEPHCLQSLEAPSWDTSVLGVIVRLEELSDPDAAELRSARLRFPELRVLALANESNVSVTTRAIFLGAKRALPWPPESATGLQEWLRAGLQA